MKLKELTMWIIGAIFIIAGLASIASSLGLGFLGIGLYWPWNLAIGFTFLIVGIFAIKARNVDL